MKCTICGVSASCKCIFTNQSVAAGQPVCKKCAGTAQHEELAEIAAAKNSNLKEQKMALRLATERKKERAISKPDSKPAWRHEVEFQESNFVDTNSLRFLIPRIFHWVWIGPSPMPEKDQAWMQSWRKHHPDWRFVVWCEHPENVTMEGFEIFPLPPLVNRRAYYEIEKWVTGRGTTAARSDIVRYEVVARYGGIYLDTDVECLKPIDELLNDVRLFVSDEWGPRPGNYMFGAVPNHPAMWTVVRELAGHLDSKREPLNAVLATGPEYVNPLLRRSGELVIFPGMLFNPVQAREDATMVEIWPKCSYGNHHYDGKWYDSTKTPISPEFLG
jgi:mannosyltransferase OCH1-like enzyme